MSKYDIRDIYAGRLAEIDKQLKSAVTVKNWTKVSQLRTEKKRLQQEG